MSKGQLPELKNILLILIAIGVVLLLLYMAVGPGRLVFKYRTCQGKLSAYCSTKQGDYAAFMGDCLDTDWGGRTAFSDNADLVKTGTKDDCDAANVLCCSNIFI